MTQLAQYTYTMNEVVNTLHNNGYSVVGNTVNTQLNVLSTIAEYILQTQEEDSSYNAVQWFNNIVSNFTVAEQLEIAGIQPVSI